MAKKEFTAEEKAEYSAKKQADMEDIFKRIDEGVNAVFTSEKYLEYLKFASKFTDYSARNTMLINMQRPDATFVGAFGTWKKLGRSVNKGEAGIKILAPVLYKTDKYEEYERPAKDEFGNQLYNDDGTEKTETVQKNVKELAFKAAYVFDLEQTNGKAIPDPFTELQGDIDTAKKEAIFKALRKVTGIDIDFEDIRGSAKGYYSPMQNRIVINTGMSDLQTLKTAFHESAHALLHDPKKKIVTVKAPRNEKEVQAESVAFMIAEKFGMDTSEYSFPYIASWSEGKQKEQLINALQEIQSVAKAMSDAIESELLKMRKRDLSMDDMLADTELNNIQKAELIIEDCEGRGVVFTKEDTENIIAFAGDYEDIQETVKYVSDMEQIFWQRESYGYDFSTMIPLGSKEAALAAFDKGEAVYLLYPDNSEGMALERYEIEQFDGFFGLDKEDDVKRTEADEHLITVSKEAALEMWDKDLDVYIDGVPAFSREEIVNAAPDAQIMLADYQYAAELDFDKPAKAAKKEKNMTYTSNTKTTETNPNVIGNTPYADLGGKNEVKYFTGLNSRHADNIAKQLDTDGVRFSGMRKKDGTTTLTINKADIPLYEAAEQKVKESYRSASKEQKEGSGVKAPKRAEKETSAKSEKVYYNGLKNRHADNVIKQLKEEGVECAVYRKGTVTNIGINKADVPRYEAVVEKVKASYRAADDKVADQPRKPKATKADIPEKRPDKPASLKDIPICTQSYLEAKQSGNEQAWRDSLSASKACIKYLNEILRNAYDARNLKGLVSDMEERFGLERTMYSIAATIQLKDHDGRFSQEVKNRAKNYSFDSERMRLNFLTEIHPVMVCAFYERLMDREKEIELPQPSVEKNQLPSHLADKFLFSTERVEFRDDHRGLPETKYYNSSANEYHVKGYGWLNDQDYDNAQKHSGETASEFSKKIDMINANYITSEGRTGQIDLTKAEYDMLTEKTYDPQNRTALNEAKKALEKIKKSVKSAPKPTEFYAVRQNVRDRFDICTIGKGNIVVPIKRDLLTIAEAKKALLDVYNERSSSVRVELIHPQTLVEKAEEMRLANPAPKREPNFEIYQLKVTEENAGISFMPMDELMKQGKTPKISSYDKVYEGNTVDMQIGGETLAQTLEEFFRKFNIDRPDDFKGHSLSVSDVIVLQDKAYYVDRVGFKALGNFLPPEREQGRFLNDLPTIISDLSDKSESAIAESVENIFKKADRLGVKPEILKEAFYMSSDQRVADAVTRYENGGEEPVAEAPKQEKPPVSKKHKL